MYRLQENMLDPVAWRFGGGTMNYTGRRIGVKPLIERSRPPGYRGVRPPDKTIGFALRVTGHAGVVEVPEPGLFEYWMVGLRGDEDCRFVYWRFNTVLWRVGLNGDLYGRADLPHDPHRFDGWSCCTHVGAAPSPPA